MNKEQQIRIATSVMMKIASEQAAGRQATAEELVDVAKSLYKNYELWVAELMSQQK